MLPSSCDHLSFTGLCRLTGSIDKAISKMTNLADIDFHNNQLTGTIDESVWYLPRLGSLDLSGNNFFGTINPAVR